MRRAWRTLVWRAAVLVGYYECEACGALVGRTGPAVHEAWHRKVDR